MLQTKNRWESIVKLSKHFLENYKDNRLIRKVKANSGLVLSVTFDKILLNGYKFWKPWNSKKNLWWIQIKCVPQNSHLMRCSLKEGFLCPVHWGKLIIFAHHGKNSTLAYKNLWITAEKYKSMHSCMHTNTAMVNFIQLQMKPFCILTPMRVSGLVFH